MFALQGGCLRCLRWRGEDRPSRAASVDQLQGYHLHIAGSAQTLESFQRYPTGIEKAAPLAGPDAFFTVTWRQCYPCGHPRAVEARIHDTLHSIHSHPARGPGLSPRRESLATRLSATNTRVPLSPTTRNMAATTHPYLPPLQVLHSTMLSRLRRMNIFAGRRLSDRNTRPTAPRSMLSIYSSPLSTSTVAVSWNINTLDRSGVMSTCWLS